MIRVIINPERLVVCSYDPPRVLKSKKKRLKSKWFKLYGKEVFRQTKDCITFRGEFNENHIN